jgi:hypothetical protein
MDLVLERIEHPRFRMVLPSTPTLGVQPPVTFALMARLLDTTLLDRLEAAWRAQGAEIMSVLAPGLGDRAMRRALEPLGIDLPEEARRWWGWHNGVTVQTPHGWEIGPEVGFYSLEQAIRQYFEERASVNEGEWPDHWLPLTRFSHGPLVIDCGDPQTAVVYRVDWEIDDFRAADSMGAMVELWLDMFDTGAWSWNPAGYWNRDLALAPARAQGAHVV